MPPDRSCLHIALPYVHAVRLAREGERHVVVHHERHGLGAAESSQLTGLGKVLVMGKGHVVLLADLYEGRTTSQGLPHT